MVELRVGFILFALVQGTALLFEGDKRDMYIRLNSLLGKVRWFYISGKVRCP